MAVLGESAFGDFYRGHSRALWRYVYRVTGNGADADDIVQEAFCRVMLANVDSLQEEELRRYLFRTASNLIADRWRRSTREQSRLSGSPAEPFMMPREHDDDVERVFGALKPRERALLWLAYVEEENHEQIGDALGLARGSVKVLLWRARARLRDLLKAKGIVRT